MKAKNQVIHSKDQELLRRLYDEYVNYIGRSGKLEEGTLTLFALPKRKKVNKVGTRVTRDTRETV